EISTRMGYPMSYTSTSEIMEEIASVTPIYAGIYHRRLENGGIPWPCTSEEHPGTPILYTERFNHPDGKARIIPVEYKEPPELPDEEYPYLLSTGRWLQHFHTGTMTRRSEPINAYKPEVLFEINPNDGERLGVKDGEMVRVSSRRGSIKGKVKLTDRSMPGMVFIPFHFSEAAVNLLTSSEFDPVAKIPEFKVSAVKIEKV
ncbi:MAG: formate dehydrogenase subunit alpha, partial [Synergistetes bacterium]|nr:formate dehydrogenase subunit alpha [Synergistota bacterium]